MEAVRILMERYWINRTEERELYNRVKRELGACRRFFTEQLGWNLIQNEQILKLEKVPAHAESYMGITEFSDVRDYCMFCAVLMFLEDREDGEQFLLSELVSMIEAQLQESIEIDWTMFVQRKSLVRVLKFAEERQLLRVYDGSSDKVSSGIEHEVLYENTGLSRYFALNFPYGIDSFRSYRDFESAPLKEMDTDRGHFRIRRVYRQLASAPALYWDSAEDADALYLKNQRQWVGKYLSEYLGGTLQIHKNAAFLVADEEDCFGEVHPREASVSEVTLNFCDQIRKKQQSKALQRQADDSIRLSEEQFASILLECKERYQSAWSKEYREMPFEKLCRTVRTYMESWMLLSDTEDELLILPGAAKTIGVYPKAYLEKEGIEDV